MARLLAVATVFFALVSSALAFPVTVGPASQCGDMDVRWSGGTGPFQLLITPLYNVPINISVPSSANGSYTVSNLRMKEGQKFVVTMSDSTGFNAGGTSTLYTVGAGSNNCNNTATGPLAFSFILPNSLQQCNPYEFTGYTGAAQPVTITGLIPGGESIILYPPAGSTSYQWPKVNVPAGTSIIFVMTDAQGGSGGASDAIPVQQSNDNSCLNGNYPTSTVASQPSSTSGGSGQSNSSSNSSVAAIAGAVVGCLVGLAAVVSLALFFIKKRKASRSPYGTGVRSSRIASVDLDHDPSTSGPIPAIHPYTYHSDSASHLGLSPGYRDHSPTLHTSAASSEPYNPPSSPLQSPDRRATEGYGVYADANSTSGRSSHAPRSSAASRKAAMANSGGTRQPARYILHTDMDDIAEPDEHGFVELPPQYTERRRPMESTGSQPAPAAEQHGETSGASTYPRNNMETMDQ